MKIIIHAGMHKTGTTTFQHAMNQATKALAQNGIRTFSVPPKINVRSGTFDAEWVVEQVRTARAAGINRLVFSHENISTFNVLQFSRLYKLFRPYSCEFILTLRAWSGYLPSRWSQSARTRDAWPLNKFLARHLANPEQNLSIDYGVILARSRQAGFKNIKVISFDNAVKSSEGLLSILWQECGLPLELLPQNTELINQSLSNMDVDVLRILNGIWSRIRKVQENDLDQCFSEFRAVESIYNFDNRLPSEMLVGTSLRNSLESELTKHILVNEINDGKIMSMVPHLEKICQPYLLNPANGRLFFESKTRKVESSSAELDDVPHALLAECAAALARNYFLKK